MIGISEKRPIEGQLFGHWVGHDQKSHSCQKPIVNFIKPVILSLTPFKTTINHDLQGGNRFS
jgi:hypothetical protein